uniref:Oxidative stress-responsive serine-rich protein 1 n=1 Tax=Phallusia mammillata TaxID=59560 RepID=A0A6F9DMC5_9ASCI|nr:oxidative stress-responsive serine-rich protein 1 [Phallusia mammillata]
MKRKEHRHKLFCHPRKKQKVLERHTLKTRISCCAGSTNRTKILKQPKFVYKRGTTLEEAESILKCLSLLQHMVLETKIKTEPETKDKLVPSFSRQNNSRLFGSICHNTVCCFKTLSNEVGLRFCRKTPKSNSKLKQKKFEVVDSKLYLQTKPDSGVPLKTMQNNVRSDVHHLQTSAPVQYAKQEIDSLVSVHDLTCAFDNFLFSPRKMSQMAEMMYT